MTAIPWLVGGIVYFGLSLWGSIMFYDIHGRERFSECVALAIVWPFFVIKFIFKLLVALFKWLWLIPQDCWHIVRGTTRKSDFAD